METFRRYLNVLGGSVNRDLYRLALSKREYFMQSKTSPSKLYPDWRRSTVIYDDQLGSVAATLEREIRVRLPEVMASLEIPPFDISAFELQLTSHNDGEYYKWHTDNGTRDTEARIVTFVYYFHGLPKMFEGGELVIHESEEGRVAIEPENDSMVLFHSRTKHEVKQVVCPSRRFEDGRFTLNGWIRRKLPRRRDDYFGYRIFSRSSPARRNSLPSAATLRVDAPAKTGGAGAHQPDAALSERLLKLYSDLHRQSGRAGKIDVVERISGPEFYENYYFTNRPVLMKGVAKGSAAVRRWSPEFFARHYGSVPVEITADRNSTPEYETDFRRTVRTVSLSDFVERLCREGSTNDFYIVARNYFFENPALRPLRQDLEPLPEIVDTADQSPGTAKLWFGPSATVTPLHYDEHSILFMQVHGRKRFKLIPPFDGPKVYPRKKYYSAVDPENVDGERYPKFSEASVAEIIVEPGDMLFLPVGWWHWARSLDVSISATFSSFHVEGRNTTLKGS